MLEVQLGGEIIDAGPPDTAARSFKRGGVGGKAGTQALNNLLSPHNTTSSIAHPS